MSVAAQTWAWAQKVPIKPKFVLVTLADQTDDRTGKVCYQRTDAKYLAEKCGVPERSLYRYLGALIRNGYVTRKSGQKKGAASEYWLVLDRASAEDLNEFQWTAADDADDPQDVEGSANLADPEDAPEPPEIGRPGPPLVADQESLEKPKIPLRARETAPPRFDKRAQDLERGIGTKAATAEVKKVFVIEGTRAWEAWLKYRRSQGLPGTMAVCSGFGEHTGKRGWFLPTLFPPPIGPPRSAEDQDLKYFAENG